MSRRTSLGEAKVRQVCQAFGVSRAAYYAALHAPARAERPRRRRERMPRGASVEQLEPRIRALAAEHPAWGVRKIRACLRREKHVVSHKRVWALMNAWGLVLPPIAERDLTAPRGQVAVPESNRRWGTDLTTVWTRRDGTVAVVPVIDCGDRVCLAIEVTKSQDSDHVLEPSERALQLEFGGAHDVPDGLELRTDHGPQFTGADCQGFCERWHLQHTFAPVGRPTGNAVTERFILTMKLELIWTRDWETIEELRAAVESWRTMYNEQRPHQALGDRTPAEQRAINLGLSVKAAA